MKLSSFILFLVFAVGGIFLAAVGFGITIPLAVYLSFFIVLIAGIPLFGYLSIVKKERYYAQEDMIVQKPDRVKHIKSIVIFALISFFGAVVFSSNKNAFPSSNITGFLYRFFKYNAFVAEPEKAVIESPAVLESFFSSLRNIEQNTSWPIRKWLQCGFVVLIGASFLLLIIMPRIYQKKSYGRIPVINDGVFASIVGWFRNVLLALSSFFKMKKSPLKRNKLNAANIIRTAKELMASYSAEKKQTMRESVTLFAQLIIWGSNARQVFWKPAHAPLEYCGLLTAASPEWNLNRGIIRCGQLFEQALYSNTVLSDEERKEFTGLVKEITAE